jgi:hypothetical protein
MVTGVFRFSRGAVYNLFIAHANDSEPIGVSENHPFWSVDRRAWVSLVSITIENHNRESQ